MQKDKSKELILGLFLLIAFGILFQFTDSTSSKDFDSNETGGFINKGLLDTALQSSKNKYRVRGLPWLSPKDEIESYAGFIPIRQFKLSSNFRNEGHCNNSSTSQPSAEMFFWYFPAQTVPINESVPLILWLQGGVNIKAIC